MKEGVTSKIGYLRISLTEQCNLRCKYCFVNDIVDKSSNITEELFCKAVENVNPKIVEITYSIFWRGTSTANGTH